MPIGTLLLLIVGIIVVFAIVFAIIQRVGLPPEVQKWVIIGMLVILLVIAIDFFFGGVGIINGGSGILLHR